MKRVIINADDFGLSPAVTQGILEAHAAGAVTSTSMMVHCRGWEDAVRQARATPALGVGLHFNLLTGRPLSSAPSLSSSPGGGFLTLPALVARSLLGALDGAEVEAECEAQLAAIAGAGIQVTHMDSHRHTHALPVVHAAISRVAARRGLPLRRPVESLRWFPADLRSQFHRGLIAWAWRLTSAGTAATRGTEHFVGVSLQGGQRFAERFAAVLDGLSEGTTEVMVHPGRVDEALRSVDGYTWQRESELETLTSRAVLERLRRGDLELVGFGAV